MDTSTASSPLMDAERTLGLLLGLHAAQQARSSPLSLEEQDCSHWLQSDFFRGGLQLLQPRNPFEEEKGESRTPSSSVTTPGKKLRTSDTLIGYLPIFQMLPKTSLYIRYHCYPFEKEA